MSFQFSWMISESKLTLLSSIVWLRFVKSMILYISQLSKPNTRFRNYEFKSEMIQKIYQANIYQLTYSNSDLIWAPKTVNS